MIDIKRLPKSRASRLQLMLIHLERISKQLQEATMKGCYLDPHYVSDMNKSVEFVNFLRTYEAIEEIN